MKALNEMPWLNAFESKANFLVSIDSRGGVNSTEIRDRLALEGVLIKNDMQGLRD